VLEGLTKTKQTKKSPLTLLRYKDWAENE